MKGMDTNARDPGQLLRDALQAALTPKTLSEGAAEAYGQVARRHRGGDLSLPVAADLVRAALELSFGERGAKEFAACAQPLATLLLENEQARPRLERLWKLLQEAAFEGEAS